MAFIRIFARGRPVRVGGRPFCGDALRQRDGDCGIEVLVRAGQRVSGHELQGVWAMF